MQDTGQLDFVQSNVFVDFWCLLMWSNQVAEREQMLCADE